MTSLAINTVDPGLMGLDWAAPYVKTHLELRIRSSEHPSVDDDIHDML